MIKGQTCSTCAAFNILNNECRMKTPMPVVMPGPSGQLATLGVYPATRPDGWCLEWKQTTDEKVT